MTEPDSQAEKPEDKGRYDPELLKRGLRCDLDQYEMLKRCSEEKDMTEWNQWRKEHPAEDIWLQGGKFCGWWMREANFMHGAWGNVATGEEIYYTGEIHFEQSLFEWADLRGAKFAGAGMDGCTFWSARSQDAIFTSTRLANAFMHVAHFERCDFTDAILVDADFSPSHLSGARFTGTDLRGCSMRGCIVDGSTRFWNCIINRYSKNKGFTDLTGTALNSVIITPGEKQLLEYNVRRMNWEAWYKYKKWQVSEDERHIIVQKVMWFVRKFWEISDYGISTKRIIKTFFVLTLIFAAVYLAWGLIDYHLVGLKYNPGIVSNLFVQEGKQEVVSPWLVPFRAVYFSIVTMTTLGFGDMYANAHSLVRGLFGHALLALQVILGYVLLGALITRFAVLFTAGGPAGKFADDKGQKTEDR